MVFYLQEALHTKSYHCVHNNLATETVGTPHARDTSDPIQLYRHGLDMCFNSSDPERQTLNPLMKDAERSSGTLLFHRILGSGSSPVS